MPYYPESFMPARIKDESQDVKGNDFLVNASDLNKHDEEIRAMERTLGIRKPAFPGSGFSGQGSDSVSGWSSFSSFTGSYPGIGCVTDVYQALSNVIGMLGDIRDNHVLLGSGVVAIKDPEVTGVDGVITLPTNWPMTTLVNHIHDDGTNPLDATLPIKVDDESSALPDLEYVTLADITNLPEAGYISIINDASICQYQSNLSVQPAAFTSFLVVTNPATSNIYNSNNLPLSLANLSAAAYSTRAIALGTNVEILKYQGIDAPNNRILNVRRRMLGSTSSRHAPSDLVFKGKLSIIVSPFMHVADYGAASENAGGNQIDCVLRSNGKIQMTHRKRNSQTSLYTDNTSYAYASWSATLVRNISTIKAFDPLEGC